MHISVKAEKIFNLFGFPITNSLLSTFILLIFFLIIALIYNSQQNSNSVFIIRHTSNLLYSLFEPIVKDKIKIFYPLLASFFLYILLSNWFGLIPGVGSIVLKNEHKTIPLLRASTADLNTTIALALISFAMIQYYGIKYLGFFGYLKKFLNFANPIAFFTGILEIISEFSKILSFAFRLFGNIFAGEVLLVIIASLIPILASFPFLILELFVGFIQALVFVMLTAIFLNMAVIKTEH